MKKVPNPIDSHVGKRVRMRRLLLGVSQAKLAHALGITFQQVQKYEKGTNRISASRLQQIADYLAVPAPFFFDGLQHSRGSKSRLSQSPIPAYISDFFATSDGLSLTAAFMQIKSPKVRHYIVNLVKCVADETS